MRLDYQITFLHHDSGRVLTIFSCVGPGQTRPVAQLVLRHSDLDVAGPVPVQEPDVALRPVASPGVVGEPAPAPLRRLPLAPGQTGAEAGVAGQRGELVQTGTRPGRHAGAGSVAATSK